MGEPNGVAATIHVGCLTLLSRCFHARGTPDSLREADCYDNAPIDSFSHTLKTELVQNRNYDIRDEVQCDIFP
ncbi:hypothetical protein ABIC01_009201 [Bradyrhizobium sp. RT4b]